MLTGTCHRALFQERQQGFLTKDYDRVKVRASPSCNDWELKTPGFPDSLCLKNKQVFNQISYSACQHRTGKNALHKRTFYKILAVLIGVQIFRTENCSWSSTWRKHVVFSNPHWGELIWAHVYTGVTPGHIRACVFLPATRQYYHRGECLFLSKCRGQRNIELKKISFENTNPEIKQSQMEAAQIPWLEGVVSHLRLLSLLTSYIFQCPFFNKKKNHVVVKSAVQYGISTNKCQTFFPFPAANRFACFCSWNFLKHILCKWIWRLYTFYFPRKLF